MAATKTNKWTWTDNDALPPGMRMHGKLESADEPNSLVSGRYALPNYAPTNRLDVFTKFCRMRESDLAISKEMKALLRVGGHNNVLALIGVKSSEDQSWHKTVFEKYDWPLTIGLTAMAIYNDTLSAASVVDVDSILMDFAAQVLMRAALASPTEPN